jgi:hypothetical protein
MNGFFTARRTARTAFALLAALAALSGCSHKITQTDPSYTRVEGVPTTSARMVTWIQGSTPGHIFNDGLIFGDISDDIYKGPQEMSPGVTGRVHIQIMDNTSASGFDLFRRDADGGYRQILDYPLIASLKWLDTGWELYRYLDTSPSGAGSDYVARGLLQGVSGAGSPVTNATPPIGPQQLQTLDFQLQNRLAPDSTINLVWTIDGRAAGYWVQIMPFGLMDGRVTTDLERNEGVPILESAGAKATIIAYISAPPAGEASATFVTGTALLQPSSGATLGLRATLHKNVIYYLRVSAVDASGRMINTLKTDYRIEYTGAVDHVPGPGGTSVAAPVYLMHPLGGVVFGSFVQGSSEKPPIDFLHDFRTWGRSGIPGTTAPAGAVAASR